jgi:dihydroorotate dehydrogenase electron transfer subunit
MVWIPSVDEIPMSISWVDVSKGIVEFAARMVGDATTKLHNLTAGTLLGLRGPLGNGYTFPRKTTRPILIAAGGCGSAPLLFAAQIAVNLGHEIHVILGASTEAELLYRTKFTQLASLVTGTTDDGSFGIQGTTVDGVAEILKSQQTVFSACLGCGPEPMLKGLIELCHEYQIPVQVSLERYMKCGVGLCGHCIIDKQGTRVCTEGPVFDGNELHSTDFGSRIRDGTGRRIAQ